MRTGDKQPLRTDGLKPDAGQTDERSEPKSTELDGPKRCPGRRTRASGARRSRRRFHPSTLLCPQHQQAFAKSRPPPDEGGGCGIHVAGTPERSAVLARARELVRFARQQGYRTEELIKVIESVG